jgi:hypothetical protein
MRLKVLFVALLSAVSILAASASPAAAQTASIPLPVSCTLSGTATGSCTVNLTGFQAVNGVVNAVVTIVDQAGNTVATVLVPLQTTGTCTILTLDTGPIHLNLLGLVVDIAPIHISVTAVSGPGNLLGNLLCAIAHLLDNPGATANGIAALLNNLLHQGLLTV